MSAESEEQSIAKKKATDEIFHKEYRKLGKKREKKKLEKEDTVEEPHEPRKSLDINSNSVKYRMIKNMIPGFSIIKNSIITPLLIASERVVEYMIPEQADVSSPNNPNRDNLNNDEEEREHAIDDRMSRLTLEDVERRQRKRTLKCLRKCNRQVNIPKNLMNKASDCVDFISENAQVEPKVTRNFVTNWIELSDSALKRIAASCKGIDDTNENVHMRFIKPSKKFYNILMSVWIKMDSNSIFNLTETAFTDHVKQALEKENIAWSDAYLEPTKTFFNVAKEEYMNLYKSQKDEEEDIDGESNTFVLSMSRFFTSIKSTLLEMWNSEIVSKSTRFTSNSATSESESSEIEETKEESKEGNHL
jgi:hypothetical protein